MGAKTRKKLAAVENYEQLNFGAKSAHLFFMDPGKLVLNDTVLLYIIVFLLLYRSRAAACTYTHAT
jgi:hypothetical protein